MQVVGGGAAAFGEGDAVVEVGELGGLIATRELAGAIAQSNVAVHGGGWGVGIWIASGWFVGDADVDA